MDAIVARLVIESKALGTEELSILMYLMANAINSQEQREKDERFKGKIFSTVCYDDLCNRYNMMDCTAKRILKKFESVGWLKFDQDGVCLGEWTADKKKFWYCSRQLGSMKEREPRRETATEQLRRLVKEKQRERVDTNIKKLPAIERSKILTEVKNGKGTTPGSRFLNVAKTCYVEKFHSAYPLSVDSVSGRPSYPKEAGFWNRYLMYCNNDESKGIEIIEWVFKNWEAIKQKIGWVGGGPNVSLFATKVYFQKVIQMRGEDYAKSLNVGQRFDEQAAKSAPSTGF